LNKWTDEETATAKRLIAAYHQVQPTIVQGDLYRLISPRNGSEFSATENGERRTRARRWCSRSSTPRRRGAAFRAQVEGLDPAAEYALTPIEGKARAGNAGGGQRRVVDEPRPGLRRRVSRRFSGGGVDKR
jgi:alpha-galactosidase